MIRKLLFFVLLIVLVVILFFSPNFKTIIAGVAILLFGMIMLEDGFKVFTKGPLQNIFFKKKYYGKRNISFAPRSKK